MKVVAPLEPLPFGVERFVEMPGSPAHHYFIDVLLTVVKQRRCDIHIELCPLTLIRDLSPKLELHGFDVYVRPANDNDGEFWLKRRPEQLR
jgi:hypothetical protein